MVPLFTSHYSIGKSILTLDPPREEREFGPTSIFEIAQDNELDHVFLVENTLTGFPQAASVSSSLGVKLSFGLLLNICEQGHRVVVFAKNAEGCKRLNKIYSEAFGKDGECVTCETLKSLWSKDLMLAVPFYDSFLFKNITSFDNCVPDLSGLDPTFFIEDNGLPFDKLITDTVASYTKSQGYPTETVKSIYYENKNDVDALQTYKCVCSRKFGKSSLSKPNLDHFGSDQFCFESYLENERITSKV
jgi:DNA polymerase III alpha subunit